MATLIGDPFRKKTENPFEQFGNWVSKSFQDIGQNIQRAFNPNQNQNQNQARTINQQRSTSQFRANTPQFNRSTNVISALNSPNSQLKQKQQLTLNSNIGGDNGVNQLKTEQPLKLNTVNNSSNALTTLNNQTLKAPNFQINQQNAVQTQPAQQQNKEDQQKQILNQRAEQARSTYDTGGIQNLSGKLESATNLTNDTYKNIFGESKTRIANTYKNNALRKLTNDGSTLSGRSSDLVNKYHSLSSDDKWDVYQNLQKARNELTQAITKADDEGRNDLKNAYGSLLSEVNLYNDMLANENRGEKSFGKSVGDWLSGGAFVGNMAEPVTNTIGNVTGNQETSRAISQNRAIAKEGNNKALDAVDFVGETVGNIGANMATGGTYGLASSGLNLGDAINAAVNDRNRQYYTDYEGNVTRENQSTASKLAGVGNAALGLGMTAAGMKGFGPNIKFNNAGQTLQSAINNRQWGDLAKTMGKYAMKEVPFAVGQTALQQGISAAGGDQEFGENFGQQLASNIAGDLAVDVTGAMRQGRGGSRDLFESSKQNDPSALQRLENIGRRAAENGAMSVKNVNSDERIPLNESIQRINDVRNKAVSDQIIGKLPINYMDETGISPNISYSKRVYDNHLKNGGNNHQVSPQELAYATNNFSNSRIDQFTEKNGTEHLNIIKPILDNKTLITGMEKQPDNNLVVTNFKQDSNDNYIRNFQKNKGSKTLYDTTSNAFPVATNSKESASFGVIDRSDNSNIAQNSKNVNGKPDTRSIGERLSDFGDKHGVGLSLKLVGDQQDGASRRQNGENVNGKSALATIFGLKRKTGDDSVQQYVKEQVALQQKEAKTPLNEKAAATIDNLKHYLVDDAVAYQRYVKDKGERAIIDNGVDRVRASDTIAKQMVEDSGLAETIGKMSQNDADEFQQYLIAKRGQELKRQKGPDFKTGRDDVADQQLIRAVGDKYAAQEKVVRDFNKMMLDYSVETGLISKELRDQLVRDNTDYVPMNRVMDDIEGMGMHKSKQLANLSKQTAVQKIKGSDRIVQNPLESMIRNAVRVVNEGERNKTAKYLADTAAFREARMPEGAKARPGYDTLSFLQDGKQVKYEVPELVAKEMKNLNSVMGDNAQKIVNILSTPARLLRAGATGDNPMFAASNLIRDQLQTVVTGSIKANIKGTPKALSAAFGLGKNAKALRAELARAGVTGTEYRQTYGYKSGELVKELQAGHQMPKQAWEKLKHPVDTIADLIGRTEYFTRAQQYFGTDGTPEQKALAARNNTLNFGRGGSAVRVLNKMIPFLNAGVQGGRITVKQFKERPVRTMGAVAATIGVAAAARALNSGINQDLYDRLGDEEKKNNLVIFTEDSKYDPETNRVTGVIKIPMPQMLYPILDAVNNIEGKPEDLLTMAGDIFTAISGIESPDTNANNIGESFLPVVNQLTPTAIKPFLETAMNKNSYTGQEIVSEYDSNKNPEDKGAKYTTDLARNMAKLTGLDAPVIDNFINNWGGGVAKDLVKVLGDNPDNKKDGGGIGRIFDEGAFRRFASGSVESQYDIAEGIAKNYKNEVKNNDAFKSLSAADQESVLNAIDTDMNKIAGISAKVEQNRGDEIGKNGLSKRQTEIMNNGFDAGNYVKAVLDKKQSYYGNGDSGSNNGDFTTLNGNALDYGKSNTARNNPVEINDALDQADKDILNQYNSMSSEDWEKYERSVGGRDAEYKLALAKFENDKANGDLTEVQEVKRQKELRKMNVQKLWDKDVRDAYGLAGNKADMQELLDSLDNRDDMVAYLNAMNRAMYEAGVITASTYKSRNRNINNLESSKSSGSSRKKSSSTYTQGTRSALAALTKAMGSNSIKVNKTPSAPSTSRKMASTSLKGTSLKKYTVGKANITVKKGIK